MRRAPFVIAEAFRRFVADDGWAIASHIALSSLMAMFPFLLVVTAVAALFGSKNLADEAARILLETWPPEVAGPLALEVHSVLASAHGGVLTLGALLALFFASSGVESLRVGLNRAYGCVDTRPWWILRIESIAYVIVGALALLALSFLVFLAPLLWTAALKYLPRLEPLGAAVTVVRLLVAAIVLVFALFVVHLWLPAGRRRLREIAPGIAATLLLWLGAGALFGRYLAEFAFTYSTYYAGLASSMIALAFLYLVGAIFIFGGELNRVLQQSLREPDPPAPPPAPAD
ncbi:MAG TPA: YihY/virulence factor BrkB family protein [Xanthobacteraceae bacterium]|nr:YihY/virulence factor BrkB family protein [Xanthobacteraceae bacterium]